MVWIKPAVLPMPVTLVMIKPLLKNAAKGGNPLVVIIIMPIKIKLIGIALRKPPIKRMSLVPMAWMMPPAMRNPRPSKKAWLTMWKRLANQPSLSAPAAVAPAPRPAIMKPIWLTVEYARTPLMSVVVRASEAPTMAVKTPIHAIVGNQ